MHQTVVSWLILIIVLVPVKLLGQELVDSVASQLQRALQELESVNAEAKNLTDKLTVVKVRARVANLLWLHDSDRARMMFREMWTWLEEQKDESFDREAARTEVLQNLFPRDPSMARELLEKVSGEHKSKEAPFQAQIAGTDPNLKRLVKLSSALVEQDMVMAAVLLERSLSVSVSPAALSALFRLREKDPDLADYVVVRTLENLRMRPTVVALPGAYVLIDYVFPFKQRFGRAIKLPDASLRMQYFSAAHDILILTQGERVHRKRPSFQENLPGTDGRRSLGSCTPLRAGACRGTEQACYEPSRCPTARNQPVAPVHSGASQWEPGGIRQLRDGHLSCSCQRRA